MDIARIAELLEPFVASANDQRLTTNDLQSISTYIDLLLRWNARINLTAVRQSEEIVTRHFGESLFAARHLFPTRIAWRQPQTALSEVEGAVRLSEARRHAEPSLASSRLVDIGSGAGFPGLPIKVWATHIDLTLIESNHKKATFLREVARALTLMNVNVFSGRAEDNPSSSSEVVALRAVERFEAVLPTAANLVAPDGRLALLTTELQSERARILLPKFKWVAVPIPLSAKRVLAIGTRESRPA